MEISKSRVKGRITLYWGWSLNRAVLGPLVDWQEWFGGYYWLEIELWLGPLYVGLEITNRPLEADTEHPIRIPEGKG